MPKLFRDLIAKHCPNWEPKRIFEIGAMDCADSLVIADTFPKSTIYSFEPDPQNIQKARLNADKNPRIVLTCKAVGERDGEVNFYQSQTENTGYSSLFKSSGKYDLVEKMIQREIKVPCIRLDTFMRNHEIEACDAMWLDAQGAELSILRSLGDKLKDVQAVWTEFEYDLMYTGQPLLPELTEFLTASGLPFIWKRHCVTDKNGKCWWGDAFFARTPR